MESKQASIGEELGNLLRSKSRLWSKYPQVAKELGANPGMRYVRFDGSFLRAALLAGEDARWLDKVLAKLPADVLVMDMYDRGPLVHPSISGAGGTYRDAWGFFAVSREWPALADGADIPEIVLTFGPEDDLPLAKSA